MVTVIMGVSAIFVETLLEPQLTREVPIRKAAVRAAKCLKEFISNSPFGILYLYYTLYNNILQAVHSP